MSRLNPIKLEQLAHAIGIEPEDFYRPPGRPSVDARLRSATDEQVRAVVEFVEKIIVGVGAD